MHVDPISLSMNRSRALFMAVRRKEWNVILTNDISFLLRLLYMFRFLSIASCVVSTLLPILLSSTLSLVTMKYVHGNVDEE